MVIKKLAIFILTMTWFTTPPALCLRIVNGKWEKKKNLCLVYMLNSHEIIFLIRVFALTYTHTNVFCVCLCVSVHSLVYTRSRIMGDKIYFVVCEFYQRNFVPAYKSGVSSIFIHNFLPKVGARIYCDLANTLHLIKIIFLELV